MPSPFFRSTQRLRAISRPATDGGLVVLPTTNPNGSPIRLRGLTFPARVTNLPAQLLPSDFDRHFLFIQNNDALGVVWLIFGAPAVLGLGIRLAAGGGSLYMDYACLTAQVNAIGTIALNPNLTIITG